MAHMRPTPATSKVFPRRCPRAGLDVQRSEFGIHFASGGSCSASLMPGVSPGAESPPWKTRASGWDGVPTVGLRPPFGTPFYPAAFPILIVADFTCWWPQLQRCCSHHARVAFAALRSTRDRTDTVIPNRSNTRLFRPLPRAREESPCQPEPSPWPSRRIPSCPWGDDLALQDVSAL
jgi:hypothetical protein